MTLHAPLAVKANLVNPFGKNTALNIAGTLLSDANGPKFAYFGTTVRPGYVAGHPHQGTDYPAPIGTDVLSVGGGSIVAHVSSAARGLYTLEHWRAKSGGHVIVCAQHLSSFVVPVGHDTSPGQHIAESGCSGQCFGAHCHVEIRFTTVATADWHYWQSWRAVNLLRVLPGGDLAAAPWILPA